MKFCDFEKFFRSLLFAFPAVTKIAQFCCVWLEFFSLKNNNSVFNDAIEAVLMKIE